MPKTSKPQKHEHVPTLKKRALVIDFVCLGFTQLAISKYFNISIDTLAKHYRNELDNGHLHRTAKLGRNLYLDALGGCKSSREFWLKTQGKQAFAKTIEEREKDDKVMSLLEILAAKAKKE